MSVRCQRTMTSDVSIGECSQERAAETQRWIRWSRSSRL